MLAMNVDVDRAGLALRVVRPLWLCGRLDLAARRADVLDHVERDAAVGAVRGVGGWREWRRGSDEGEDFWWDVRVDVV